VEKAVDNQSVLAVTYCTYYLLMIAIGIAKRRVPL
jgi:hypothetical protein